MEFSFLQFVRYLALLLPVLSFSEACEDYGRTLHFTPRIREKALKGHVIKNLSLEIPGSCQTSCYLESDCVSYNLGPLKDGRHVCELSNSTTNDERDLVHREGFIYRETENACSKNRCCPGLKCQNGFTDKGYRCIGGRGLELSSILGSLDQDKYLEKLLSYLDPVLVDSVQSRFVRCYHAQTDGWASTTFHSNCDGKGPTVTIIKVNSYIFGAYTNTAWDSSCSYSAANKAFIFSLYNSRGYAPEKLNQRQNQQNAMQGCSTTGTLFGSGYDIYITNDANNNHNSYTNLGFTYHPPSGCPYGTSCSRLFLAGTHHFTPTDVEVFYETTQC